jgi:Gpi18-like mannosyltransferase
MNIYNEPLVFRWLYLFVAWDSNGYINLAHFYTFDPLVQGTLFPGYPILIKLLAGVIGNYWIAAIVLSIIFGFALLPVFQAIAECYMTKGEALGGTLIMGSFPYVFVYTTVAYSESLFLLSVLATWYLYLKDKLYLASLSAILATFTKTYGILIVLPLLLDLLVHRRWKKIPLALVPVLLVASFVFLFRSRAILERMILEINTATWQVSRVGTGYFWVKGLYFQYSHRAGL